MGLNKFKCTGTEKLGEKTRIILFLAGSVPFKMPPNYGTTLVDADHSEVPGLYCKLIPTFESPLNSSVGFLRMSPLT